MGTQWRLVEDGSWRHHMFGGRWLWVRNRTAWFARSFPPTATLAELINEFASTCSPVERYKVYDHGQLVDEGVQV